MSQLPANTGQYMNGMYIMGGTNPQRVPQYLTQQQQQLLIQQNPALFQNPALLQNLQQSQNMSRVPMPQNLTVRPFPNPTPVPPVNPQLVEEQRAQRPDFKSPFTSLKDVVDRLGCYRVFMPTDKQFDPVEWTTKVNQTAEKYEQMIKEKVTDKLQKIVLRNEKSHADEAIIIEHHLAEQEKQQWENDKQSREQNSLGMDLLSPTSGLNMHSEWGLDLGMQESTYNGDDFLLFD